MDILHGAFNSSSGQGSVQPAPTMASQSDEAFLPRFSGLPKTISITEFLERFDHLARIKNIQPDDMAMLLKSSCTDNAWRCLSQIVTDQLTPQQLYSRYRELLVRTYGLSEHRAFATLVKREFDPTTESVDQYASDVSYLSRSSFPISGRYEEVSF